MQQPNTYQTQAQVTKAIRTANGTYAKQKEQKAALKAYSEAMRVWREGGKVTPQPLMSTFWHW